MEDISIIEYKKKDLTDAMCVVAFPTVGMISSIAGHYIIDSLNLEEIGTITSKYFTPTTVIHKSHPSPPVRIYAGKKSCGPEYTCKQIVVIISEFMPHWEIIKPLVEKIFKWADEKKCKMLVALEGTHAFGKKIEGEFEVFGIGSTKTMKHVLDKYKIIHTKEGMITGVTGVLLYEGVITKRDVLCLLAEAHADFPDSRAAGNLLQKLDVILPGIKIDPKPLYKEAEKIENDIKKFIQQSKPTAPALPQIPTSMYG